MLKETQSTQQALSSAFYITGGTLRGDAACYVRRQADESLFESLSQGQFCYVLTSRQMGKSSLMIRTAERLRESGTGVVVLDLTAVGQNLTAEQWYDGLLNRIGRQLQLEDELESFWLANPRLGPLQRWMNAITEVVLPRYPGRLVIFIDEIDTVRSLPFTTDEFFAGIREFYNRRTSDKELERLTFCLLGVASPSDLIRDTRMTPFNIGRRIELNDFSEEEAAPLARGLGRDERMGTTLLNRILYWTGGHPYLTQRLCLATAEDRSVVDAGGVDRLCEGIFLARRAQEGDDNLLFVRERMLRSEVDVAGLLTLYGQVHNGKRVEDDETSPLVTALHLSGIARHDDGHLKVRNRIYEYVFDRKWVMEHMPDAELRRQQAAYRKGIMRAAAVATAIVLVIAALAFLAFNQRNIAKAEAERADQNLRKATSSDEEARKALSIAEQQRTVAINQQKVAEEHRNLADQQRLRAENQEESNRQQLYAAQMQVAMQAWEDSGITRMVDLLDYHIPKPGQKDLRGFEWYFLWGLTKGDLRSFRNQGVSSPASIYSESAVAFFPDNRRLVTTGSDTIVKIWDIVNGKKLMALKGHNWPVWSVAISPDNRFIASSGEDSFVKIWDTRTEAEARTLKGHTSSVYKVAYSPDGKKLATASKDNSVKIWDVNSGRDLITLSHPGAVTSAVYSPDGKLLATACADFHIRLFDAVTSKELKKIKAHSSEVICLVFSPDGKLLASSGGDLAVKFWDVAAGTISTIESFAGPSRPRQITYPGGGMGLSISFSPDGTQFAVGYMDRIVRLHSTTTLQMLNTFKGHGLSVDSVSISPNGKLLATSSKDGVTKIWDIASKHETSIGTVGSTTSIAFSPDSRFLASSDFVSKSVKLWDVKSGINIKSFEGHLAFVEAVEFSHDGKKLATGSTDNTAKVWDVASGKELFTMRGHNKKVWTLAISPDDRLLATGSDDQTVRLWDFRTGRELHVFKGHNNDIASVAFSPDSCQLATASYDRSIKIWNVKTRREMLTLGHPARLGKIAYSPDGQILAAATADGLVRLWDLSNRKVIRILKGHHEAIDSMAFMPDGSRLVTGSWDTTVKIWDVATGQELLSRKQRQMVLSLAVSPDGKTLAIGSIGGYISLWHAVDPARINKNPETLLSKMISPNPVAMNNIPHGWKSEATENNEYETGIDQKVINNGKFSCYLKSLTQIPSSPISLLQSIKSDHFRGKRVRLSSYLKTDSVRNSARLYLRVDGGGFTMNLDDLALNGIQGTTEWKRYEIVMDVPADSLILVFGVMLRGTGHVWADDLKIEIVDSNVPLTGWRNFEEQYRNIFQAREPAERKRLEDEYRARAKNLPLTPVNLDFEDIKPN